MTMERKTQTEGRQGMRGAGRIFVLSAPSGTGKTTLARRLVAELPGLEVSVSHTTRAPRAGEIDHRSYHFVTRECFQKMIEKGEFLEWAEVYGFLYGTSLGELDRRHQGHELLLDLDVQGAHSVRKALPEAVLMLLLPPSWEALAARLKGRGTDAQETIERRLRESREQLESYEVYDYAVVNDDLETAFGELKAIVMAERCAVKFHPEPIERLLGVSHG